MILLCTIMASYTFAQPPKDPRSPAVSTAELGKAELFGKTIEAVVEVAEVTPLVPAIVNGQVSNNLADLHLQVRLFAEREQVFGARNIGDFIPYQRMRVQITNRSNPGGGILTFDLLPTLGNHEGWQYGSNVSLPSEPLGDPFNDQYLLEITMFSDNILAVHYDAVPPSALFRDSGGVPILSILTSFGSSGNIPQTPTGSSGSIAPTGVLPATTMPIGNVDKQRALVSNFETMNAALPDFATASILYSSDTGFGETLKTSFTKYEDPSRYAANRGITAAVLASAEDNVANALAQNPIGNDCNVNGTIFPLECGEWVEKGAQRMFYLNLLHELDEAIEKVPAGEIDAISGAGHNWDEAWAFWQAIRGTATSREGNCEGGEFGPPANIDCDLVDSIDDALSAGASDIASGGAGIQTHISIIETRLAQIFYLAVYHEIFSMRGKAPGDVEAFGKARAEARAFFSNINYLAPSFDATAIDDREQASFTQTRAQDFMQRLSSAFANILTVAHRGNPATIP